MRTTTHRFIIASLVLLSGLFAIAVSAQTIGLQTFTPGNTDGYVLFSPIQYTSTYLIDKCGRSVHRWSSTYKPGQAVYTVAKTIDVEPQV